MEPATTIQRAYGFQRNNSRRYCEFKVNAVGGDPAGLWLGMAYYPYAGDTGPETAVMYGGLDQNVNTSGSQLPSAVPPVNSGLFGTISAGDIWHFHVDFGGGTDHLGVQQVNTITDGFGNIFLPICGSVGRNGTWHTTILGPWICAARGFTGNFRPVVMREDHSTSAASVSLRVVTASFSLTIPTGAIAWGDGAGQSSIVYTDVRWDSKASSMTWTSSQRIAYVDGTSALTTAKSSAKRKAGRLRIEFTRKTDATTYDEDFPIDGYLGGPHCGLVDFRSTTVTACISLRAFFMYGSPSLAGPASRTISVTQTTWITGGSPVATYLVDFDQGKGVLVGARCIYDPTGSPAWGGDLCTMDHAWTFTFSVSLQPFLGPTGLAGTNYQMEINGGALRFNSPFYPGWTSWDGTRFNTIGIGSTWDTDFHPSSISAVNFFNANYTFYYNSGSGRAVIRAQGQNSTGKRYFEFYKHASVPPVSTRFGIIKTSSVAHVSTSYTDTVGAIFVGVSAGGQHGNAFVTQDGATISATPSCTLDVRLAYYGEPLCVAVDFDNGKLWFGNWDRGPRTHDWRGGNPVAGTGEHASFTAGASWYAVMGVLGSAGGQYTGIFTSAGLIGNLPTGYTAWDGTTGDSSDTGGSASTTATSSGSGGGAGGLRVLWPYGVQT